MAKFLYKGSRKKYAILGTAALLSMTLALGTFTACGSDTEQDEEEDKPASATDTQLIKNGNFEFYSEMDTERKDKRAILNSPTSWSFTSGSPSSNTGSGIIDLAQEEWDTNTKSFKSLISAEGTAASDAIKYAIDNWDEASVYDRLEFYEKYDDEIDDLASTSTEAKFFADYKYSADFEDVQYLRNELGNTVKTHSADAAKQDGSNVLMIHNRRTSDNVRGTGQYYTSSTTVTLNAGTAAHVSVWVKTAELYHFYAGDTDVEVTRDSVVGGAYIGVTNTAGGTTLDQMQIKNIRTIGVEENNGWVQYHVFVRASTFATSTFRIVLGLGQSTSSDRYEAVDGYALFDDLSCTVMTAADYDKLTKEYEITEDGGRYCSIDSDADDKLFDAGDGQYNSYALDLYAGFDGLGLTESDATVELTKEISGTKTYESKVSDNRGDGVTEPSRQSMAGLYTYADLLAATQSGASYNGYLANFFEKDFKDAFPFVGADGAALTDSPVVLLMSTNGAAYTAEVTHSEFALKPESYMLVSFFVKTSAIRSGRNGASAVLVDANGNETPITAFDSTTLTGTNIKNNTDAGEEYNQEDIYNGWTQCFFFVENDTESDQTFSLKLRYGTTEIASSTKNNYADGYAAFANFTTKALTKTQYGYCSTGDRAVKVSLADNIKDDSSFDSASVTSKIENGLANPANFWGIVSTSIKVVEGGGENKVPEGVYTGLLNAEHAANYKASKEAWATALNTLSGGAETATTWWSNIFGDSKVSGRASNQPLVILNTNVEGEADSYGYFTKKDTISADSYRKISMRVKLSAGMKVYLYLIDLSDVKEGFDKTLAPTVTKATYWYDDNGNICRIDPADKDFNKKKDTLFLLEKNGLYSRANANDGNYYANLRNYESDETGNLITPDKTTAYYFNDGKYYAYYDKKSKTYSQVVENLPTEIDGKSILRYSAPENLQEKYGSMIEITGTEANAGQWIDVAFYVHTGNVEKNYRLELWAGSRDNKTKIPANGYAFFDSYASADVSSDYATLLSEKTQAIKDHYNNLNQYTPNDESYLDDKDNLPEQYALYRTFTFYDSPSYLRYDESEDEEDLGNPYGSYKQSAYSEQLIWLVYDNSTGTYAKDEVPLSYGCFLDYTAHDVTVEAEDLDTEEEEVEEEEDTTTSESNFWLLFSSAALAIVLILAVIVVLIRILVKHLKQTGRIASSKKKPAKKTAAPKPEKKAEEPKKKQEPDENNPYNE